MRVTLLSIAFALSIAAPAIAEHCTTWSTSATNENTLVLDLGPATVDFRYVVYDHCQPDCLFSIWLYYESNGIEGLQRGDEVVDDSCHWMIESDYFVW